jgi:beta-lactamase regulating signal transducer with metallopeptidase domain
MNQLIALFSQPWADRLGWTLVHFIWQGTAISLTLAIARMWIVTPRWRHTTACLGLASMALAPIATFFWLDPRGPAPASLAPAHTAAIAVPVPGPAAGATPDILPWLVMAWVAGVAVLSVRLAGGWVTAARLRYSGTRPAPPEWQTTFERFARRMNITRQVRLMISAHVDVPAVLGWLRPMVLAPVAALSGLPPEHVEALLLHELAHIRRNDFLISLFQGVVETALFYHPAVWWVSAQIRAEREHCCDDLAVEVTADVLTYARALAELETCRSPRVRTAIAADGGSLLERITRLLEPGKKLHTLPRPAAACMLSALLVFGLGTLAVHAAGISVRNLGIAMQTQPGYPTVARNSVWIDSVKTGDLQIQVRGLGKLVSPNLAELKIAETLAKDIRVGQSVTLDYRGSQPLYGQVTKIHPEIRNGTITVDVATTGLPPTAGRPPLDVDGIIQISTLPNVVYVGRPAFGRGNSTSTLYRLEPGGDQAVRVTVQFGAASVNAIEVRSGLLPGDKVILSDTSAVEKAERINLR